VLPPAPAARSSGRNRSATPVTPSAAAARSRGRSGTPNATRTPIGVMNTIVEYTTATSPDTTMRSAQ
jgi:hypothetical protein